MLGNLGVILVIGGLALVAIGALRKFEFKTEAEFQIGPYETETEFEFEIDKETGEPKRGRKRRGRDRPNPEEQPYQIDTEKPMLVPSNIDMFPYYNRSILY